LAFVTYGAEAVFLVSPSVGVVGGIEAYSAKRNIPEALLEEGEASEQWNTILPFNVGMQYQMGAGDIHPYLGGDLLFIPGYVKDSGGMATGLRARTGLTYMLVDTVGLNLNASAGILAGKHFENVQQDMSNSALVPQISGGTTFVF